MKPEELSVFDFTEKLKNGEFYDFEEGLMFATVTVEEDTVTTIRQV